MEKTIARVCTLGVVALLATGCGEEAPKQSAPAAVQPPVTAPEPQQQSQEVTATEKAKQAMAEASTSVKEAASTVSEKVEEQAMTAKDKVTEVTANLVEKTADKVTQLATAVEATVAPDKAAEKTYKGLCFSCHDMGIAGAPKLGDKAVWAPRISAGMETLYSTAINGKGAMPPKGGNAALSDAEIKAVVDYMVAQSQ